jgi:hypothetical protein
VAVARLFQAAIAVVAGRNHAQVDTNLVHAGASCHAEPGPDFGGILSRHSDSAVCGCAALAHTVNARHLSGKVLRKNPRIASVNWSKVA